MEPPSYADIVAAAPGLFIATSVRRLYTNGRRFPLCSAVASSSNTKITLQLEPSAGPRRHLSRLTAFE